MDIPRFNDMAYERPDIPKAIERYNELANQLRQSARNLALANTTIREWDTLRSRLSTASHLISVRYQQNTTDAFLQEEKKFIDDSEPTLKEWDLALGKQVLDHPLRSELEKEWGEQFFTILRTHLTTFKPEIADFLREESELCRIYTDLLAQAQLSFNGETVNLSALRSYMSSPDRHVRESAQRTRGEYFKKNQDILDELYHKLVTCRNSMARALGYRNFVPLGYALMTRTDYTSIDVARFRDEIYREVVPLARGLRDAQRVRLKLDRLYFYDEAIMDPTGNPKPIGNTAWIVEQAAQMFRRMGEETGRFFTLMRRHELLDLDTRAGKAGGGFCTEFPDYRVPFIFANFNGTEEDISTLCHECGHAFQSYMSRDAKVIDYLFPTLEACEIHSMSMEFLTAPYMDLFFGKDAERFRTDHLRNAILFLPYAAAVDEFQHHVYENPTLSLRERRQFWQEMEKKYLPWRDYAGLPHTSEGGLWQGQSHIYASPFYYIDYALAQTCALQLWKRNQEDPRRALDDYYALCRPGGSLPFLSLIKQGRLVSPFEPGCLTEIVAQIKLKINDSWYKGDG